jgi:hypothetical protein
MTKTRVTQLEKKVDELTEQIKELNRHDCQDYAYVVHGQVHCKKCLRLIR